MNVNENRQEVFLRKLYSMARSRNYSTSGRVLLHSSKLDLMRNADVLRSELDTILKNIRMHDSAGLKIVAVHPKYEGWPRDSEIVTLEVDVGYLERHFHQGPSVQHPYAIEKDGEGYIVVDGVWHHIGGIRTNKFSLITSLCSEFEAEKTYESLYEKFPHPKERWQYSSGVQRSAVSNQVSELRKIFKEAGINKKVRFELRKESMRLLWTRGSKRVS